MDVRVEQVATEVAALMGCGRRICSR